MVAISVGPAVMIAAGSWATIEGPAGAL